MALIKCQECGKEFSDKAGACIHCGCPIGKEEKKIFCVDCGNELKATDKVCSKCGCPTDNLKNNDNKNTNKPKKVKQNKGNKVIDVIRYLVGLFCFMFVFTSKGLSMLFILLSVVLVLPITSKFIYEKINVPKALKIIVPIVLMVVAMLINPAFQEGYEKGLNGTSKDNINESNLQHYLKIYTSGTIYSGNVFKPIISITPINENYTCKNVSFTLDTYITYEGNKISKEIPIDIELNENCKYYSKDEMSIKLTTNPHASALVKYSIKYVKGQINK